MHRLIRRVILKRSPRAITSGHVNSSVMRGKRIVQSHNIQLSNVLSNPYCTAPESIVSHFFDGLRWSEKSFVKQPYYKGEKRRQPEPTHAVHLTKVLLQSLSMNRPVDDCIAEMDTILEGGVLDEYLYHSMISYLLKHKRYDKAIEIFNQMKEDSSVIITYHTYNSFIRHHISLNQIDKAKQFWVEMEESGIKPGPPCFCSLLRLAFPKGKFNKGLLVELTEKMREYNIRHDKIFYHELILMMEKYGNLEEALELLNRILKQGFAMNRKLFTTMIRLYGKSERIDDLMGCIEKLEEFQIEMDVVLLSSIMKTYLHLKQPQQALDLYERFSGNIANIETDKEINRVVRLCRSRKR